jgi:hypothetical protein
VDRLAAARSRLGRAGVDAEERGLLAARLESDGFAAHRELRSLVEELERLALGSQRPSANYRPPARSASEDEELREVLAERASSP